MRIAALSGLVMLALCVASTSSAAGAEKIEIESIKPDQEISGRVEGVGAVSSYKVVVYVKTDQWYIHPFSSGGVGRSYAEIAEDGSWSIPTVERGFPASQIAALVVKRDASPPSRTDAIAGIDAIARIVRELTGTDDYGKL